MVDQTSAEKLPPQSLAVIRTFVFSISIGMIIGIVVGGLGSALAGGVTPASIVILGLAAGQTGAVLGAVVAGVIIAKD